MSWDTAGSKPTVSFPTSAKDGPCRGPSEELVRPHLVTDGAVTPSGQALTAGSRGAERCPSVAGDAGPGQARCLWGISGRPGACRRLWGLFLSGHGVKGRQPPARQVSLVGSSPFC